MALFPRWWLDDNARSRVLLPVSGLFRGVTALRRSLYRQGLLRSHEISAPVLVVGNVFIGGTGKTPLVAWLAQRLSARGLRPGIVTRGYGGRADQWPQRVTAESDARLVGDEAVLLARRAQCPVLAGPDRVGSARLLAGECDLIISDDGLQHYRLRRDAEIVVFDAARGAGNGRCLPAGPLREPLSRLAGADLVVVNGGPLPRWPLSFRLRPLAWVNLRSGERRAPDAFTGLAADAVAGIGNPARFFEQLRGLGIQADCRSFPDHHAYEAEDLPVDTGRRLLMTEKDAVKCAGLVGEQSWYLEVGAAPDAAAERALDELLRRLTADE
ncbi:tetraacyldisaccharide 4'-kinase [Alkalilimnicola sp. S0819]|uniref:tetraacyldisaccharide 4'-kinase n=1 Tax=Alkalilimnicola sp. S0819 TaxID=2613922 RepID=UPI001261887A|nr:tetraacyldisaccharide 4'-kinase [Alkalilimnicola sp. S0819]KAB7627629.1 tetraacyldisaccharide 4'-kinase [Alkalilimnicola sp. S0819]MPQ15792.1 tetraacyldisaccharide 4'-kinase [Alkalilimnicola sp. S0819]